VHCAQTAEDIDKTSLVFDSPMSFPDHVKILLTSVNLFVPKFCPNVTHLSVDLIDGDNRSQIRAKWLEMAQWSQLVSLYETTVALSNGAIATLRSGVSYL